MDKSLERTLKQACEQKFKIPLIIWGENPQQEYGGPLESIEKKITSKTKSPREGMFFFDVTILSVCGGVACMGLVFKV